jgi:hypothetical protein
VIKKTIARAMVLIFTTTLKGVAKVREYHGYPFLLY